jgi:hypothetical protein
MTIWENIVKQFDTVNQPGQAARKTITLDEYEDWKKTALFDHLRSLRYGQSFCNTFNIMDNILYFTLDRLSADIYILKHYVR